MDLKISITANPVFISTGFIVIGFPKDYIPFLDIYFN
jgi:hypothetical protein